MHRIVSLLALAVVLAGCGGTDWKTTRVSASGSANSAQAAAAERPYIDAMLVSAKANGSDRSGTNPTTVRCILSPLVLLAIGYSQGSASHTPQAVTEFIFLLAMTRPTKRTLVQSSSKSRATSHSGSRSRCEKSGTTGSTAVRGKPSDS